MMNFPGTWTLFLDRDGVINRRIVDGYVRSVEEFEFLPAVPEAIERLSNLFERVIIVTNQQGIGKGLMSVDDLQKVHAYLRKELEQRGGRVDKIYFAEGLSECKPYHRKPSPGMALQAKREFPDIAFHRSVMVGDSGSDVAFGRRLGMKTVGVGPEDHSDCSSNPPELIVSSLLEFANSIHHSPLEST